MVVVSVGAMAVAVRASAHGTYVIASTSDKKWLSMRHRIIFPRMLSLTG
jgi:hypothetical protein